MADNALRDLEFLRDSPVEILVVSKNQITSVAPLKGKALKKLGIADDQIADLSPLRGMPIKSIDIHGNKPLRDLTPLLELPRLDDLRISNLGKLLEPLRAHPTLKSIAIDSEPLRPVAEF